MHWLCLVQAVVKEYDTVSKLDDWTTTILLRIKKAMSNLC